MLCRLGAVFVNEGWVIPPLLRDYLVEKLKTVAEKKTARRGRPTNWLRDFPIIYVIARLTEQGFPATRNNASREKRLDDSACSIIIQALGRLGRRHFEEDAVEKIWEGRKRLPKNLRAYIDGDERLSIGPLVRG